MAQKSELFNDPEFDKISVATYLVNKLSLNQMLSIERLVRSGKITNILKQEQSEHRVNSE